MFLLTTDRLLLREWIPEDAEGMLRLNLDPDVYRFTGDRPFKDLDAVKEFIHSYDQYRIHGMGRWSIILKNSGDYLGWCGLKYLTGTGETDLGYRLLPDRRGFGYAQEAAVASLDHGFTNLGLKKIVGRAVKENVPSIRVLKKLGMVFEKEFQEHGSVCEQYYLTEEHWSIWKNRNEKEQSI